MIASNDNQMGTSRFSQGLLCPDCGKKGRLVWAENVLDMPPLGSHRRLLFVSPGFHGESGRTARGETLIVCDDCDMIQPV